MTLGEIYVHVQTCACMHTHYQVKSEQSGFVGIHYTVAVCSYAAF